MIPVSPTRLFATDRYPNKHLDKRPHFVCPQHFCLYPHIYISSFCVSLFHLSSL
ncbi:unnamed protein product [Brassica napus]|uniref:Uncharacterized protein n=2 Tax=Brassica TaxID=3705 RepID=A0A0D3CWA8_BRAOL|nr:unnamed protein product [Brassica napus]